MKSLSSFFLALAFAVVAAVPALAHHPFAADYDVSKPLTLTGTVNSVLWENPHVHATIKVPSANGEDTIWDVELGSPADLGTRGWTRQMLKTGEKVTIEGWQAKDGTTRVNAKTMKFGNSKMLSAASSYNPKDAREERATSGKN